jgi:hypothetical protein
MWGLVKSVLFHSLHLGITLLLTLLFTLFNSNLGPAALGTHQPFRSLVELTYLQFNLIHFTLKKRGCFTNTFEFIIIFVRLSLQQQLDLVLLKNIFFSVDCPFQGVTKRCRLPWLTNSALVYEPKCRGKRGGVAGPQSISRATNTQEPK